MMQIIPPASEQTIIKLLDVLPEPHDMRAHIFGGNLVGEFVFKMDLPVGEVDVDNGYAKASIKHPTKDKIKKLLTHEGQVYEKPHGLPRMDFVEATFHIEDAEKETSDDEIPHWNDVIKHRIEIKLSMYKLEVVYYRWENLQIVFDLLKGLDTSELEVVITKHREEPDYSKLQTTLTTHGVEN